MKFKHSDIIERPLNDVYFLVKDNIQKIVPFLPNVEKIETVSQEQISASQTKRVNKWYAHAEIPAVAKKFVSKELLSWTDYALWDDRNFCVNYDLKSNWAQDLYTAKGLNSFRSIDANKTEFTVECDVIIYPDKIPGVPKFLVQKVLPHIEKLIEKIIAPNMSSLGHGIKDFYKQ